MFPHDVEVAFKGAGDFDSGQDNRTFPGSVAADLDITPEQWDRVLQVNPRGMFLVAQAVELLRQERAADEVPPL